MFSQRFHCPNTGRIGGPRRKAGLKLGEQQTEFETSSKYLGIVSLEEGNAFVADLLEHSILIDITRNELIHSLHSSFRLTRAQSRLKKSLKAYQSELENRSFSILSFFAKLKKNDRIKKGKENYDDDEAHKKIIHLTINVTIFDHLMIYYSIFSVSITDLTCNTIFVSDQLAFYLIIIMVSGPTWKNVRFWYIDLLSACSYSHWYINRIVLRQTMQY